MSAREALFAAVLAVAGALVTTAAAITHPALGFAVGGVLLAVWSWFVLGDV